MEYLATLNVKFVVNICITHTNVVFNLFYNGCFAMYTHKLLLVLQNMWQKFWIIQHWNDYENLLLNCKWICLTLRLLRKGLCVKRNSGELKWLILIRNFMKKQNLVPCVGYSSTLADQKWEISHKRKLSCKNRSRNESY